jgi:hypothetical protein
MQKHQTQTESPLLLRFFTDITKEEKVQVEKNFKFTKFSFFCLGYNLIFLIELLKLKFRDDFIENFMALLLKKNLF